jgi:hypothetical protein
MSAKCTRVLAYAPAALPGQDIARRQRAQTLEEIDVSSWCSVWRAVAQAQADAGDRCGEDHGLGLAWASARARSSSARPAPQRTAASARAPRSTSAASSSSARLRPAHYDGRPVLSRGCGRGSERQRRACAQEARRSVRGVAMLGNRSRAADTVGAMGRRAGRVCDTGPRCLRGLSWSDERASGKTRVRAAARCSYVVGVGVEIKCAGGARAATRLASVERAPRAAA